MLGKTLEKAAVEAEAIRAAKEGNRRLLGDLRHQVGVIKQIGEIGDDGLELSIYVIPEIRDYGFDGLMVSFEVGASDI